MLFNLRQEYYFTSCRLQPLQLTFQAELMKDVDGWEVGTLMGEPIYKTVGMDDWHEPTQYEYFVHADESHFNQLKNCIFRR